MKTNELDALHIWVLEQLVKHVDYETTTGNLESNSERDKSYRKASVEAYREVIDQCRLIKSKGASP
ncbi:hypothetical protein LCGC14_0817260 [marine sediment metagenome]|uniref:Uncharacterized protein n=1 Tax=marine sediment metagenome TaxID=412755 RepID=A0A0F9PJU6_9ZZZZ